MVYPCWLDRYIEEQAEQRRIMLVITGGIDPAELQEEAERLGWDGMPQ